jgi:hypothetical protein
MPTTSTKIILSSRNSINYALRDASKPRARIISGNATTVVEISSKEALNYCMISSTNKESAIGNNTTKINHDCLYLVTQYFASSLVKHLSCIIHKSINNNNERNIRRTIVFSKEKCSIVHRQQLQQNEVQLQHRRQLRYAPSV